jgi:hypothetical protein
MKDAITFSITTLSVTLTIIQLIAIVGIWHLAKALNVIMLDGIMLIVSMLSVAFSYCYAERLYAYAELHDAERCWVSLRCVIMLNVIVHFLIVMLNIYMLTFSMLNVTVLSVAFSYCYVERCYVKCHYAEGRSAAAKTVENLLHKRYLKIIVILWQDYDDENPNQTRQCVDGEYGVVEGECDSYTTCSNGVLYTKLCSPGWWKHSYTIKK